ncbi:putative NAD(P)-binding domain superfamily [Helianthus annuus]|uniref:NAD(P)-binding domain superfamily n=1 Tax=Helianthus annuus TaxID=4232 RepID=A0A251SBC4_HELAN|nr:putative NAD(P)-binding domain superfamily [Helianthus annuus]KAJ0490203.1 putative NAD(P)-binding domain superfamily [Helianthus annuus]KAJ0494339.1 putative NAD(P)-binding domain superfamily [Helianthus annuus]KAJ0506121.1 putative NAD(P)-binding domain superfamily [Helianthus annuus]KAJ0675792.1 putative NAD(P)-binding domain superfamily [Helianthus annuus]
MLCIFQKFPYIYGFKSFMLCICSWSRLKNRFLLTTYALGLSFHVKALVLLPICRLLIAIYICDTSPHLTKGSSTVFISSISAYQPLPAMAMYGVIKTALLGLTKRNSIMEKTPL